MLQVPMFFVNKAAPIYVALLPPGGMFVESTLDGSTSQ